MVQSGLLPKTDAYDDVRQYLTWFERRMLDLNGQNARNSLSEADVVGENTLVHPKGLMPMIGESAFSPRASDYAPYPGDQGSMRQIRQQMRMLTELAKGAEDVTAPLAALSPNSRLVRDVVRLLDKARQPLLLLGEPGGGKSTVLREVATRCAQEGLAWGTPPLPVYVVLGTYRSVGADRQPAHVLSLVAQSIPREFAVLRVRLGELLHQGRLVIFFDGIDEMDRDLYTERNQKLSEFACRYRLQAKTLFACRTANFSPAFEHQQVFLLPFSRSQIREYVRKNFPRETLVDGTPYSHKQIVRRLLASQSFHGTVQLPLTLFLLRYYVLQKQAWPESRHQIYGTYVEFLYGRLWRFWTSTNTLNSAVQRDEVISGWEALAYEVMLQKEGTCLSCRELDALVIALAMPLHVTLAEKSGLLRPELSDEAGNSEINGGTLRFSHHQIQEYLAAKYLIAHYRERKLNWASLIDSPRWQQTLMHAASINPTSLPALAVLEQTLAEIVKVYERIQKQTREAERSWWYLRDKLADIERDEFPETEALHGPEKEARQERLRKAIVTKQEELTALRFHVPSRQERIWADRVVLTSQLFKEAGGTRTSLRAPIPDLYAKAVKCLADQGRPPSQVKMLWAFRNAPDVCARADLAEPFRSPISWVREQAIAVIGSLAGRVDADLDEELMFDIGQGQLLSRVPAYFRGRSGRSDWIFRLGWAGVCYALLNIGFTAAALSCIVAAVSLTGRTLSEVWSPVMPQLLGHRWNEVLALFGGVFVLTLATKFGRGLPPARRLTVGGAAMAAVVVICFGVKLSNWTSLRMGGAAALVVVEGIITWVWSICVGWTYALPVRLLSGHREVREFLKNAMQFYRRSPEFTLLGGGVGLAVFALFGFLVEALIRFLVFPIGSWFELFLESLFDSRQWQMLTAGIMMLLLMGLLSWAVVRGALFLYTNYKNLVCKRATRHGLWATLWFDFGLLMTMVATAVAFYRVGLLGKAIAIALAGVLAGFLVVIVGSFVNPVLRGISWVPRPTFSVLRFRAMEPIFKLFRLSRAENLDAREWRDKFIVCNEFAQARMLRRASETSLSLGRSQFLAFLESCELYVKADPASGIYWRMRHELEEILKQEHSVGGVRTS
jgi:hypothetical protein